MAGYRVKNSTDKPVWITIYNMPGEIKMGYGNVDPGKSWDFTAGFWAVGSYYKLLAEYPTSVPHAWKTDTTRTLKNIDVDEIELIGNAKGGHWE